MPRLTLIITLLLAGFSAAGQTIPPTELITRHGRVEDGKHRPLAGALVHVDQLKGATFSTNSEGAYLVPVPPSCQFLVISYVGYIDQKVALQDSMPVVTLQPQPGVNLRKLRKTKFRRHKR